MYIHVCHLSCIHSQMDIQYINNNNNYYYYNYYYWLLLLLG